MRNFSAIADYVDVIESGVAELRQEGPVFQIEHSYWRLGTICQAGEEVSNVSLLESGRLVQLPLPLAMRLLFDYFGHNRHCPRSASQIANALQHSDFYQRHAMNSGHILSRKFSIVCIKEYVKRIRKALGQSFEQANLKLDPSRVLVSEPTVGNEVQYRLRARAKWLHSPGAD